MTEIIITPLREEALRAAEVAAKLMAYAETRWPELCARHAERVETADTTYSELPPFHPARIAGDWGADD